MCTRTHDRACDVHVHAKRIAMPTIVLNFCEEILVIRTQITKFMKILCQENLELYGMCSLVLMSEFMWLCMKRLCSKVVVTIVTT